MLSERGTRLVTRYVDGELKGRQRKLALRLLRRSSAARALLQKLHEDAHALVRLPHRQLPATFPGQVLKAIRTRRLRVGRPAAARPIPAWVGTAAAAAILVMVGGGSFALFYGQGGGPRKISVGGAPVVTVEQPRPRELPANGPGPVREHRWNPHGVNITGGAVAQFANPVEVRLGLNELVKPNGKTRLTDELKKDSAFRLDVAMRNQARAAERLQAALKEKKFDVHVDAVTQKRLKDKKPGTFVLFAENLQPEELAAMLEQLGLEEKLTPNQGANAGTVLLSPFGKEQKSEMSKMLGVKPDALNPLTRDAYLDLPVPILKDSTKDTSKDGSKDGGKDGGKQTKPVGPAPRVAVLIASNLNPMALAASPEVKAFLQGRLKQRPGTLQVMVVLAQA